ncbi:MAG: c-type cytochrome [Bacillota bacterium]
MRTFRMVVLLVVSAFLFATISIAQDQQQTKKERSSKKTHQMHDSTNVSGTGTMSHDKNTHPGKAANTQTKKERHTKKTKVEESRTESTTTGSTRNDETGAVRQNRQDDKTAHTGKGPGNMDAKQIFMTNKCNSCHSIEAEKVTKTGKSKAPDLSDIGTQRDAEFIQKFLNKEETVDGKKHPVGFKGTKDELKLLATWLSEHGKK